MRYKQRKRKSDVIVDNQLKDKINGKDVTENEDNEEDSEINKIDDKIEDKIKNIVKETNVVTIESNNDLNSHQISDKNGVKDKTVVKKKQKYKTSSFSGLDADITENDKYFSSLIDLIPAKIYFEGNEEILESMEKQKRDLFGDDLDLSKKSKQKRFKLDPNSDKKISEIANNFYNKSNKKSNKKQSIDNKMNELKRKLNEKIMKLKSNRGQKIRNQRETKKERKKLNSMRASKQKGFSKRQYLDSNQTNGEEVESKPKKLKTNTTTDGNDNEKVANNLPKIYNKEGNIVYSKFDLVSSSTPSLSQKKNNSKKNKLQKLLVKSKKEEQKLSELEARDPSKAQEVKEKKLWRKAIDLSEGIKVKDNSKLIKKSMIRKRKEKMKSRKEWTERKESLQKNMESKKNKREQNIKERQQNKRDKKLKRMKKRGHILDNK